MIQPERVRLPLLQQATTQSLRRSSATRGASYDAPGETAASTCCLRPPAPVRRSAPAGSDVLLTATGFAAARSEPRSRPAFGSRKTQRGMQGRLKETEKRGRLCEHRGVENMKQHGRRVRRLAGTEKVVLRRRPLPV